MTTRAKAKSVHYPEPRPTAWLWRTAGILVLLAGGVVFVLRQRLPDQDVQQNIRMVVAVASVAVGLCVICAMAGRWVRR